MKVRVKKLVARGVLLTLVEKQPEPVWRGWRDDVADFASHHKWLVTMAPEPDKSKFQILIHGVSAEVQNAIISTLKEWYQIMYVREEVEFVPG